MTGSDFSDWLADNKPNSQKNYLSGVRAVSKEMLAAGTIEKPLFEMNRIEYEIAIMKIFLNSDFKKKDKKGNQMYSNSLKHLQSCLKEFSDRATEEKFAEKIISKSPIAETEKDALIKSRIGQGAFKQKIVAKYGGKCIITKIAFARILIASHIKPWAVSTNEERLDGENGFLLSPTYDKLFDLGLISFKDNGNIIISKLLDSDTLAKLRLEKSQIYDIKATANLRRNLEYHRDAVFVG
ncbi:MAG: HNH endonuclease [Ruminococcus flavefaciens]|nr:HNH endonuclease [Ruminococcus flavefaciens]